MVIFYSFKETFLLLSVHMRIAKPAYMLFICCLLWTHVWELDKKIYDEGLGTLHAGTHCEPL